MAANPITYAEIEAFTRITLADLTAWEIALIKRVDLAVLDALAGQTKPGAKEGAGPAEIPVSDTRAIGGLFRGLAAKRNNPRG
ncbi:hypothetical protein D3C85_930740 [compost metagenome]